MKINEEKQKSARIEAELEKIYKRPKTMNSPKKFNAGGVSNFDQMNDQFLNKGNILKFDMSKISKEN